MTIINFHKPNKILDSHREIILFQITILITIIVRTSKVQFKKFYLLFYLLQKRITIVSIQIFANPVGICSNKTIIIDKNQFLFSFIIFTKKKKTVS